MAGENWFQIRAPQVVSETVDGEVIVVDLASGNYFSLRGTAAYLWNEILRGACVSSLVQCLEAAARQKKVSVEPDVRTFIAALVREGLMIPVSPPAAVHDPASTVDYEPPVFEKFSDMQEFLLVDPIHEVNVQGWPYRDPSSEKKPPAAEAGPE